MWRGALAVVLVSSLVFGQGGTPADQTKPDSGTVKRSQQSYLVISQPQVIRQGANESAVIHFFLSPTYVISPYETSRDFVPLKVEFDESEGVKATSFHFDSDWRQHFAFHDEAMRHTELFEAPGDPANAMRDDTRAPASTSYFRAQSTLGSTGAPSLMAQETRVRVLSPSFGVFIRLDASKRATLGPRLLHGRITYQAIFENGVLPPQQMELTLPLTVVDHGAITAPNPQFTHKSASLPTSALSTRRFG